MKRIVRFGIAALTLGLPVNGWADNSSPPPPKEAFDIAMDYLKAGKQREAEDKLEEAIRQDNKNQRVAFFLGACARSRWVKQEALPIFAYVVKLNPDTPEAKCAALMLAIDTQDAYADNFSGLVKLQEANPDNTLILWMTAVACRELGRRGAPRSYSEKGAEYYGKLLKAMNPGPVLLHQTCANILSEELGRHEDALKHRELAIQLEPAAWSYQGMANTLTHLGRFAHADTNYAKSAEMAPRDPTYLNSWAWSMERRGNHEKAYELYKKSTELDPDNPETWRKLSRCAAALSKTEEAGQYLEKARALEQGSK